MLRIREYDTALYYMKEDNIFMDGEGSIVFNLFEIVRPNDIFMFKHYKENMLVQHATIPEGLVELFYPEEDDYCYDVNLMHDESIVHMVGDDYERISRYYDSTKEERIESYERLLR